MYKWTAVLLLFIAISTNLSAQINNSAAPSSYEYYIHISGINSRQDVIFLEQTIAQKTGITFFMANRFPVRYFLMRSDHSVNAAAFQQLVNSPSFYIDFYGEGNKGREQAILLYNKSKAKQ